MATQAPADPSVDQDTEKGEATMEKRYPFALTTSEIDCVLEALQAQMQPFPPSAWRYSRLSVLASLVERLKQLPEQVQGEQVIQMGMD